VMQRLSNRQTPGVFLDASTDAEQRVRMQYIEHALVRVDELPTHPHRFKGTVFCERVNPAP